MDDQLSLSPLSRRRFLAGAGLTGLTGLAVAGLDPGLRQAVLAAPADVTTAYPFTLGVASGDPDHHSVVLWTRLAPTPLDPAALGDRTVPVRWEVFADEGLHRRVAQGRTQARPDGAHTVHVEVDGLRPDTWYWYRFTTEGRGGHASPVGRTRTFPSPRQRADRLRFGLAGCQHYETGFFTAYRHLADDDLDVVFHYGDYIYEGGVGTNGVRRHNGPEITTLADYRNRLALYKTDPDLQAAHAAFPFVMTWDDHEVENNYAGATSENDDPPEAFLLRRAAAYQAYWEHMPLRRSARPTGPDMPLYRRLAYGDLAGISVLDTRQFRSDQACGDGSDVVPCGDWADPARTITGDAQERWLIDGLARSRARWNVISQQVIFSRLDSLAGEGRRLSMDKWDGYPGSQARVLDGIARNGVDNVVVLTGDVHRHYAFDIKADVDDPASATLGAELVATSITSSGDGDDALGEAAIAENPHLHYYRNRRGYVRCELGRTSGHADFLIVPYVTRPGAPITVDRSFALEAGQPGLH
jgi:alkaline phosphatase D